MTNVDATLNLICAERGKISAEAKYMKHILHLLFPDYFNLKTRCEDCIRHDIHTSKRQSDLLHGE